MGTRNRVLSFMNNLSNRDSHSSPSAPAPPRHETFKNSQVRQDRQMDIASSPAGPGTHPHNTDGNSPQPRTQRERPTSRPMSMVQTYQPPLMDVSQDTPPELQPIFTFLNSHANKLYQEGYFLKLDDQNTQGRPNADRTWTECFAQLVGTVLSLWDASELDVAGQEGEVLPKFINLTDASIKMIESLPTRSDNEPPLQNVLSISTAGRNRYLLHFNSHHSLVQWTAGIRLAMFEHATLQEAYTGALIAGKGKTLNSIGVVLERAKFKHEDWARVRFGAGTPWRRCWCVITPPDEKEVQKLHKLANKKKSVYDRSRLPVLKGDIKFYDTKKTKKTMPIATITDAYSAFAIYPQSKPLIDASTLVKVEGNITIHSNPPSTTEGFVFVMPEVHPAVTGFEIMLRWLFPAFDTFALYGRPARLIADTLDPRSLMFAMPKHRRYGYLEILDVTGLIVEQGSGNWKEAEWRRKLKELTQRRMTTIENGSGKGSRYSSRRSTRASFGPSQSRVQFDDGASAKSTPSSTWAQGPPADGVTGGIPRTDSAPPSSGFAASGQSSSPHNRSVSDTHGMDRYQTDVPAPRYDSAYEQAPTPPPHSIGVAVGREGSNLRHMTDIVATPDRVSSEDEHVGRGTPVRELQELQDTSSPAPVSAPPAFSHPPGARPLGNPYHSPELRRANSRMSNATLSQMAGAGGVAAAYHANAESHRISEDQRRQNMGQHPEVRSQMGVPSNINAIEHPANQYGLHEGLVATSDSRFSFEGSSSQRPPVPDARSNPSQPPPQYSLNPQSNTGMYESQSVTSSNPNSQNFQSKNSHIPPQSTDLTSSGRSQQPPQQPPQLRTGPSVTRKPLPKNPAFTQTPTAETPSSADSLAPHIIDQVAFDMIGRSNGPKGSLQSDSQYNRQLSASDSVYEDNASTTSPDYASTRRSIDTQKSVERPRAGVKKTVGVEQSNNPTQDIRSSIHIDFGPTLNYASDRLPMPRKQSPGPAMNNYPARPDDASRSKSPNRKAITPENSHYRTDSRTLAWQPGLAVGGNPSPSQQTMTAEQFVQQRAAAAIPLYAHQRQPSGNTLGRETPTPPLDRNRSSDYIQQLHSRGNSVDLLQRPGSRGPSAALDHSRNNSSELLQRPSSRGALAVLGHSRNSSTDLLQRPGSRGASATLSPAGTGDITSKLSAREQEHVARLTGQPLISMAQNSNRSGGGLVGAIEAREHEKQQVKQGINSQAVQHAITQRQQQAMHQQYPEQMQGGHRGSQSQYNMAQYAQSQYPQSQYPQSQYPQSQYPQSQYPMQAQNQQAWVSPAANVFAQGGGWSNPSPGYANPEQGRQSPTQYPPRQQYFPQQQQGGQGRGNQGGYGHAL
ncbi:uncharacterized protein BP5553_06058 [Venustampulla echinocandica]|uniref:PH domain-containing protein n=1 Tax=Venustampulla echinocandica TaxID=2656787 RepID=A0A370TMF4_9HELO|nr:uncharacterized protein BP5553_06058 [Venustampulla echinocandica]RDL36706.1 hypothetical protein BP5553_06058 [Venustampulla echinocandica]